MNRRVPTILTITMKLILNILALFITNQITLHILFTLVRTKIMFTVYE